MRKDDVMIELLFGLLKLVDWMVAEIVQEHLWFDLLFANEMSIAKQRVLIQEILALQILKDFRGSAWTL